jgi:hypothetical protein
LPPRQHGQNQYRLHQLGHDWWQGRPLLRAPQVGMKYLPGKHRRPQIRPLPCLTLDELVPSPPFRRPTLSPPALKLQHWARLAAPADQGSFHPLTQSRRRTHCRRPC